MTFLFMVISLLVIPALCLFIGLQVIALGDYFKGNFEEPLRICLDLRRYFEYKEFFFLVLAIMFIAVISMLWNCLFSKNARERYRSRILTREERQRFSKLQTRHQAKLGTQRLEFDKEGHNLGNDTFRGKLDVFFNPLKVKWNNLCTKLKFSDRRKTNTLKNWHIEGNKSGRRGGPVVVTSKNAIWVDAEDTNSLVVGTTRSGKTFGIINILIQSLRMGCESMIVMDVKGELYNTHAQSLKNDGYDVIKVDFINPKKSVKWNPFGIIIKKYRQAYEDYLEELNSPKYISMMQKGALKSNVLREVQENIRKSTNQKEKSILQDKERLLKKELKEIGEQLPKPNYSEAKELISDIAMRLCAEPDAKDPFWSSSATTVLEGYINFLLEEKYEDENGKTCFLPDEMINMYSVKLLHDQGKSPLNPKEYDGCSTVLQYYIKHFRSIDDESSMKLKEYIEAPDNTKGSISAVFGDKIKFFLLNDDILSMTSKSEFELRQLGERKTAIFIAIHDEKTTYHELPSVLISQTYEELIKSARNEKNLRLKVPVYVVWDEFANGARWDNIDNALSAGLSRGVRYCLVIQDYSQLQTRYDKKTNTIKDNCQNLYYLLAGENQTLEEISKLCGTKRIWNKNKNNWDDVPVLSTDALHSLSMGEAVVIRQRKYAYKTRLNGFNTYSFFKNLPKTPEPEDRDMSNVKKFNIMEAWKDRQRNSIIPTSNIRGGGSVKDMANNTIKNTQPPVRSNDHSDWSVNNKGKSIEKKQLLRNLAGRLTSELGLTQ